MSTQTIDTEELSPEAEDLIFEHLADYRAERRKYIRIDQQDAQKNRSWMAQFQEQAKKDAGKVLQQRQQWLERRRNKTKGPQ